LVCAKSGDFARRQVTPRARRESGQPDGPNAHAGQFGNGMPDRGQHAPHLPVASFKDGEFYLRPAVVVGRLVSARIWPRGGGSNTGAHRPHCDVLRAPREAVFQHEARAQTPEGIVRRNAAHFRPVRLGDMVLGVRHLVQKVAVVRQEDQAFAFLIQSPDRAEHGAGGQFHQIRNERGCMRIAAGRDHAARLVQGDIVVLGRRGDGTTVKQDLVHAGLDFRAQFGHHFAVDPDAPILNPHLTRPA